jgi:hypothetical protein
MDNLIAAPTREPRRSLSNLGGAIEAHGDLQVRRTLREILGEASRERGDLLTHGFHSYPGRMHPVIARRCMEHYTSKRDVVLDPFCGSGTVLIEAVAQGRDAVGVDLNPLAIRLATVKCWLWTPRERESLLAHAEQVEQRSLQRVQTRTPIRADLPPGELKWYEPHVLKELAGLWHEIQQVPPSRVRDALQLVFSSMVVKFSKQKADTSQVAVGKRIRKGLVSEFFLRKASELAVRLDELRRAAPRSAREPQLMQQDVLRLRPNAFPRAAMIITSPPYVGTYDYVAHHERRFAWLGIDPAAFHQRELGARRAYSRSAEAERDVHQWSTQFQQCLRAMHRVMQRDGKAMLLIGDGQIGRVRIPMRELVRDLAPEAGFTVVASASQSRDDWHSAGRARPRQEHLIALKKTS